MSVDLNISAVRRRRTRVIAHKPPQRRDPEGTRRKLLAAAKMEFANKGLAGARVNAIAARARLNKQLVYHYFGSKEKLYVAVLEDAYAAFRAREAALPTRKLEPEEAVVRLAGLLFDSFRDLREEVAVIADENIHQARHVRNSERVKQLHQPLILMMEDIVTRGERKGVFRRGIEPIRLFILLLSLSGVYVSNKHTLSAVFDRDLGEPRELEAWRAFVTEFVITALRP
jgi:TetR/AcrR family transcriptional regulator